jgi:hypothetical protein
VGTQGDELKVRFAMLGAGNTVADHSINLMVEWGETKIQSLDIAELNFVLEKAVKPIMGNRKLFVITDTLVASQVQVRRLNKERDGISAIEFNRQFAARSAVNSKGHLVISGPLVVGFRAIQINAPDQRDSKLELVPMPREAQRELGKLQ